MFCFPVLLAILACALGGAIADEGTRCPPSAMRLVLKSHRNLTSSWQSGTITQHALDRQSWKVKMDHKTIEVSEGYTILETTLILWASETSDSFDVPEAQGELGRQMVTQLIVPSGEKVQTVNQDHDVVNTGKDTEPTIPAPLHRTSEKSRQTYYYYRGVGYYKFHHGVTTWPAARDTCAQEGGHLVIINSEAEREVVRELFVELNPISEGSSNPNQIHVGLKRAGEGNYTTIFGVPMEETGFSEWSTGQPSVGAREPCVSFVKETAAYNDISCNIQILAFICEIELHGRTANQGQDVIHIGTDKQSTILEHLESEAPLEVFPVGYELYPGVGYYKFHRGVATWPAARDRCAQEGGHLVIINSEAEREVVRKLFVERNPISEGASNSNQIHAGLRRVGEGNYTTIFGVPMEKTGFSEWSPGQPSSIGNREPCVSIMKTSVAYNDISCRIIILPYICEVELPSH